MAKKTTKTAKTASKAKTAKKATTGETKVKRQTWSATAKEPKGERMDALIDLMRRKDGAAIKDFQEVKGFNLPSMAVYRAAENRGYKVKIVKVEGSPKRYFATGSAAK